MSTENHHSLEDASENASFVTFSVVSHRQGHLLNQLLQDFHRPLHLAYEIIVTLNIPEDESFLSNHKELPIRIIRNSFKKGFGANHNAAFRVSKGDIFVVVNPDIRAESLDIRPLIEALYSSDAAACGPLVLSASGDREDSARRFPTVARLVRRIMRSRRVSDYSFDSGPVVVDWVAGMFVAFKSQAFHAVGGYDERYFMYMEDADICRRLRRRGGLTLLQPAYAVRHYAQRASHRSLSHLRWHLCSALRFLRDGK